MKKLLTSQEWCNKVFGCYTVYTDYDLWVKWVIAYWIIVSFTLIIIIQQILSLV